MTDPTSLIAILTWINAGQGDPPFDQITTFALVAECQDRGLTDSHGEITDAGRAMLAHADGEGRTG